MPPTLEARREALAVILKNRADADLANTKTFLKNDRSLASCDKFHYRMILRPWTDVSLGDCCYLDTCRNLSTCKFIHYEVELSNAQKRVLQYEIGIRGKATFTRRLNVMSYRGLDTPPQWISCDIRDFPMKMFNGLVSVVMADPPWDIHMELPYGTMADDEMRHLPIHLIQNHGLIFLWVTGRAMELGKECLKLWGYEQVEEIVWVKTNQLHRLIRTGRTGHWINHSKEHCLIGIKGSPNYFPFLDCDVIVSEVRETSRKPDEIYKLIERLAPDSLKLELFGRMHNTCRNWITLGNQLDGVNLVHSRLIDRYNAWRPSHLPEVAYPADSPGFHGKSDKPVSGESVFSIESL
jgi:mRNA (2'-O-methyladenosine-N6-)-methyltransferase